MKTIKSHIPCNGTMSAYIGTHKNMTIIVRAQAKEIITHQFHTSRSFLFCKPTFFFIIHLYNFLIYSNFIALEGDILVIINEGTNKTK